MKKFIAIYHAPAQVMAQMGNVSQENQEKSMQAWYKWKQENENHIVDFGAPLMGGQQINTNGDWSTSSKEVSGYSILQGNDVDEVKSLFKTHPHLNWAPGCYIEVHETMAL